MPRISLGGSDWQVKEYYGEDWRWRDAHLPINRDTRSWYRASVPGTIQNDLWTAGEIPNPYFERNSLLIEWIPDRTWVYRKTFRLDAKYRDQRAQLCLDGIDYEGQIYLNGVFLGRHVGMYTPAVFEVAEHLNFEGENLLAVIIEPAPHEIPQIGRTSLVRTHKSRMTYWWDFCPRVVHVGLWGDVTLEFGGPVRLTEVFVRPELSADFQQATVSVHADFDALFDTPVTLETTLYFGRAVISQTLTDHALPKGNSSVTLSFSVNEPRLWYPNGYGDQPLYKVNIRILGIDDTPDDPELDKRATRFGIRKIELVRNITNDPTARPYTFVVNGRRIYIKGWNWVPMDVMYGVPRPAKLENLLTLAQKAHINLLRIWGGGLIETEAFYNRCDELGIMVWQEFIMSSSGMDNNPSTDSDFIDFMVGEAELIIPRKRNHPSLAVWCGGNELMSGEEQPLDDDHALLAALKKTVERLDPDRIWLPTSPTGRVFSNSIANIEKDPTSLHDTHGPWEYQGVTKQYTLYNMGTSLLHSEFGVEGITNLKSLNATMAPENQFPVTLDNRTWHHLGAWWVKARVWDETFGEVNDIETMVRATQLIQADGLRYALEADRRRKYQSSGTLPWQFNEPFPMAACTSAVDYYGQPKPAYYAVARAYAPLSITAEFATAAWAEQESFAATVWINNSYEERISSRARIRVIGLDGEMYVEWTTSATLKPDRANEILKVTLPLDDILTDAFFLDLAVIDAHDQIRAQNRYSFTKEANLAPLLSVPRTTLSIQRDVNTMTITNTGTIVALFVWLEDDRAVGAPGFVYFEDNHFCLLPNETRTISLTWQDVPLADRRLSVGGWNTDPWKGS